MSDLILFGIMIYLLIGYFISIQLLEIEKKQRKLLKKKKPNRKEIANLLFGMTTCWLPYFITACIWNETEKIDKYFKGVKK